MIQASLGEGSHPRIAMALIPKFIIQWMIDAITKLPLVLLRTQVMSTEEEIAPSAKDQ